MIVVFTSNTNGAMTQMSIHLLKEFTEMGIDSVCFLPQQATVTVPVNLESKLCTYNKVRTMNRHSRSIIKICEKIKGVSPDLIVYVDNGIVSSVVALSLVGYTKQIMTFHDAGAYHPSNHTSLKDRLHTFIEHKISRSAANKITNVMVMSRESEQNFKRYYPESAEKTILVPLGAHIPDADETAPEEHIPQDYFLFFGRIDKYKGISDLLEAYSGLNNKDIHLVIAGKGSLSEKEQELCKENNVILLNRYISDGEMKWLFKHSKFLILPYIQATQSGIIPIAYSYGIPVITSNVPGLTQFVQNGKTGFICSNIEDYKLKIEQMWNMNLKEMSEYCTKYYSLHLDWKANLRNLLNAMEILR